MGKAIYNKSENRHINKYIKWLIYILLLTSVDTILFGTNSNTFSLLIPRIVGAVSIILIPLIAKKKFVYNVRLLSVSVIMILLIIVSTYTNEDKIETALSRIIVILTAMTIANCIDMRVYLSLFDNFVYIISCVAIVTQIVAYVTPSVFNMFPKVINSSNLSFRTFFLGAVYLDSSFIRSMSIFWEPGAFAIYLVFALLVQWFFLEKINNRRVIIYLICLFFTFSTTGFIACFVLMGIYLIGSDQESLNKYKEVLLTGLIVLIAIVVIGEDSFLYNALFAKISNNSSTTVTRYASIINGFEIAFDNPFLGISPGKLSDTMAKYAVKSSLRLGANYMNTNTVTGLCASYGLIYGSIFLTGTFLFFKKNTKKLVCAIGLFVVMLLGYCGEYFYSFFPFILVFYGIRESRKGGKNA